MIAALALSVALTASPVTSGYGWAAGGGVTHLDDKRWWVAFYDSYSRTQGTKYATLAAAELEKHTGLPVRVTPDLFPSTASCPARTAAGSHRIVIRIDPATTRASVSRCTLAGAAWGSKVMISKTAWLNTKRAGSNETYRRNVMSHEMGHAMGLGHPKLEYLPLTDPLMSGNHWGGYATPTTGHKFTPYDVRGLKQLVLNR